MHLANLEFGALAAFGALVTFDVCGFEVLGGSIKFRPAPSYIVQQAWDSTLAQTLYKHCHRG